MTHLDIQGRAEKTWNSRPDNVKDVRSTFIFEPFWNYIFSTVIKRPNVCWADVHHFHEIDVEVVWFMWGEKIILS